jgi:hypothetical protein
MGLISRIRDRRNAKKPVQQYYGGSEEAANAYRSRNNTRTDAAEGQIAGDRATVAQERIEARDANARLGAKADATYYDQTEKAQGYGARSDDFLNEYDTGKGATLAGANTLDRLGGQLEANANSAAANYQSAADKAFKAATERSQQQALSIAAGRGNGSVRSALATSGAANAQAALDQQVVRANEMNQIMDLQRQGLAQAGIAAQGASNIRSGVGNQDLTAAQTAGQRQQAATNAGLTAIGQGAGVTNNNAVIGQNAAGTLLNSATGSRDAYLGSGNALEIAQLGGNQAYELQRQAAAKENNPFQRAISGMFDAGNMRGAQGGNLG